MSTGFKQITKAGLVGAVAAAIVISVSTVVLVSLMAERLADPEITEQDFLGLWNAEDQFLELSESGEARGNDGCNGQGSQWTFDEGRIQFEGFFGTKMACPDESGEYKNGWLGQSASASFENGDSSELFFYDRDGELLGSMERGPESPDPRPMNP
jgi:heat shock protein HslJ